MIFLSPYITDKTILQTINTKKLDGDRKYTREKYTYGYHLRNH